MSNDPRHHDKTKTAQDGTCAFDTDRCMELYKSGLTDPAIIKQLQKETPFPLSIYDIRRWRLINGLPANYRRNNCVTVADLEEQEMLKKALSKKMSSQEQLVEINRRANAIGLTYGEYVAKYGGRL